MLKLWMFKWFLRSLTNAGAESRDKRSERITADKGLTNNRSAEDLRVGMAANIHAETPTKVDKHSDEIIPEIVPVQSSVVGDSEEPDVREHASGLTETELKNLLQAGCVSDTVHHWLVPGKMNGQHVYMSLPCHGRHDLSLGLKYCCSRLLTDRRSAAVRE